MAKLLARENIPPAQEKRREQNRLAQQRFRPLEKHRQRKRATQPEPTSPLVPTSAPGLGSPLAEGESLADFLSIDDSEGILSPLNTCNDVVYSAFDDSGSTTWALSDHYTHASCDSTIDFSLVSSSQEIGSLSYATTTDTHEVSTNTGSWQSSLHSAVQKGHTKIVELLLRHEADCDQADSAGLTALMHATVQGYDDVAELLLSSGAGVECLNHQDQSALHLAVMYCRPRLLRKLLSHCIGNKELVNGYAKDGKTPLHIAIEMGSETAVELLLGSGADMGCKLRTS